MLQKLGRLVGVARPVLGRQLQVRPSRYFGRVIPETLEDVLAYKKPKETAERWEKFEFEDGRAYTKRIKTKYATNPRYVRLQNLWKNNVIRKQKRKERRLQRLAEKQPVPPGATKLVIHTPLVQEIVVTREIKHNSFAVMMLNGKQYKVVEDDLLLVNQLKNLKVGDVVEADKVLLVGTKEYTLLGRPMVEGAKVIMTVESQTKGKKVIVFKKKRRKGYRRSIGFRALQTFLRIHRIEFDVPSEMAARAIPLWRPPQIG